MAAIAGAWLTGRGLKHPAVNANNWSTPDAAALDLTDDFEIEVDLAAVDWTPAASKVFFDKAVASTNGYVVYFSTDGKIGLYSDSPVINAVSTAATGFTDGDRHRIKLTRNRTAGEIKFFTHNGSTWVQLGTTVAASTSAMSTNAAVLRSHGSQSGQGFACTYYRVTYRSAIDGTIVFDANFAAQTAGDNAFAESSSNAATVTINSTDATSFFTVTLTETAINPGENLNGTYTANFVPASGTLDADPFDALIAAGSVWEATTNAAQPVASAVEVELTDGDGDVILVGTVNVTAAPSGGKKRLSLGLGLGL